jgi:hypothetical protein
MVKKGKTKDDAGKIGENQKRVAMMVCCPDGEGKAVSPQMKDEILMKLGSGLGDRATSS